MSGRRDVPRERSGASPEPVAADDGLMVPWSA